MPSFTIENNLCKDVIIGCDEVGRGAIAGPVVTAAVYICNKEKFLQDINKHKLTIDDSKKLNHQKRHKIYNFVQNNRNYIFYTISAISHDIIDEINILNATKLSWKKSILKLIRKFDLNIDYILLDGNVVIENMMDDFKILPIIKGDSKSYNIALASIIAKYVRDYIMIILSRNAKYYKYFFHQHKGYATKLHKEMIDIYGISDVHRKNINLI